MQKVIYISYLPLTKKRYYDFYLDFLSENGKDIEYWDLGNLYFPNLNLQLKDTVDLSYVKRFHSLKNMDIALRQQDINNTLFIVMITYEGRVISLFRLLTIHKCKLAFFARGMYPIPPNNITNKLKRILKKIEVIKIIKYFQNYFQNIIAYSYKQFGLVKTYDIVFQAGSQGSMTIGVGQNFDIKKSRIVNINYFDFDKYLQHKTGKPIVDGPYCVFLDEYLPFHPDDLMLNNKSIPAEPYYMELNKFFDMIERKMHLKVVIAAHPKASGYEKENPFCGREIFFDKSCELVRDTRFAMSHHSTSISFPILFNKPLLFLTSKNQKEITPGFYNHTKFLSLTLNSPLIYFDSCKYKDIILTVDENIYNNYKYCYLTSEESEHNLSKNIYYEYISQFSSVRLTIE